MSRQAVIVDTNVLVAGLLTGNATSPAPRILDGMLGAAFPFVVSEALLAEYRAVLVRPALRKLHGLTVTEVGTLLTDIAQQAIVLPPSVGAPAPDPGDQLLCDLLAAKPDLLLVTSDQALQRDAAVGSPWCRPQAFVDAHDRPISAHRHTEQHVRQ